jgi:electron transport complex protein RnfD
LCLLIRYESGETIDMDKQTLRNQLIYTTALILLTISATIFFGLNVLVLLLFSFLGSLPFEFLFSKLRKKPIDYGWMVYPLLLVLLLPPNAPWWLAMIASAFGVVFGKLIFGGSGKYIFPPSLVGVLFAYISFPSYITAIEWMIPSSDLLTGATPLLSLNRGQPLGYSWQQLLLGGAPGTLGETFRLGIILLGLILFLTKVIDWKAPLTYLVSVFVLTGLGHIIFPDTFRDPILSLLVGGLLFGAIFIAGDQTIIPKKTSAKIYYGIGLGLLTVLIRHFATFPEGVTFSIIIMSAISPLFDTKKEMKSEEINHE